MAVGLTLKFAGIVSRSTASDSRTTMRCAPDGSRPEFPGTFFNRKHADEPPRRKGVENQGQRRYAHPRIHAGTFVHEHN